MSNETNKGILVIAEQNSGKVHRVSYELLGKGRELALAHGCQLAAVIAAPAECDISELAHRGADKVYHLKSDEFADHEELLFASALTDFIGEMKPGVILVGATNFGRSLAPRVAAELGIGLTADCTELVFDEDGEFVQVRPAFSDNILAHIKSVEKPCMCTVRYKEFPEADHSEEAGEIIEKDVKGKIDCRSVVLEKRSEFSESISDATVVVAGGRGVKNKEDMTLLQELADLIGGTVGASRALVDAGIALSAQQVGYSGNRVKPDVYIACGISGAPQHLAGMKESGKIIAINSDASAPIFSVADIGYVGDLYQVIPKLIEEIKAAR